ncbi:hypothetical protein RIB2604_00400650 [Aspergillus luchuensis]|uniref:Uncharacterized protein n=1 Tax=Aspergillus kawachii TaxID=1069201 RepID=A0A146EZU3_ASPKA|nr:hypothetical protein RIB2604_00400650 [Aspergillus luchuensis]
MLKNAQSEGFQGQGRESRIQRPNEVFVKPLCFFNLKTDAFNRFELFSGISAEVRTGKELSERQAERARGGANED